MPHGFSLPVRDTPCCTGQGGFANGGVPAQIGAMSDPVTVQTHEVVVLGGGPGGSAAAALLAQLGRDVALVHPSSPQGAALAQSVPPSARRLLAEVGLLDAVDRAGFRPNEGNTVRWAGGAPRSESFPPGSGGFHATRGDLEAVFSRAVESLGAHVRRGTSARSVERFDGEWRIRCASQDGGPLELRTGWLLDATGRTGVVARHGRVPDRRTETLALLRRYRRPDGWDGADATHTVVESHGEGWAWSLPLAPDVRCVTTMVDPPGAAARGSDPTPLFEAHLAHAPLLADLVAGAEPLGDAWACPASLYTSSRFAEAGLVLVGDAGSFIDPLSSYGVKKALASGWLAGVVAHTGLVDPGMAGVAAGFFHHREESVYRGYRRLSARFFEEAAAAHGHRYWASRAEAARAAGGEGEGPTPEAIMDGTEWEIPEDAVRAAHRLLREQPHLEARAGAGVRVVERPAVEGRRVVMQRQLASARAPGGVRFATGVDLLVVTEQAPLHREVPDLWHAYNRVAPPVGLPEFLTGLATAFAAGFLEHGAP